MLHHIPPSFPLLLLGHSANFTSLYKPPLFSRRFGLLNDVVDIGVNLARRVVSSVVQDEVSPPLLGVQTRPGGGRCDIPWVAALSGHLPF